QYIFNFIFEMEEKKIFGNNLTGGQMTKVELNESKFEQDAQADTPPNELEPSSIAIDNNFPLEIIIIIWWIGKYMLIMNYVSVGKKEKEKEEKNKNKEHVNERVPFAAKSQQSKTFARNQDNLSWSFNNHLLFITYRPKNISVFDLNKFKFLKETSLPID
ncbi:hypothetical protein RFI_35322, partial [Reticulomyxa filosa]